MGDNIVVHPRDFTFINSKNSRTSWHWNTIDTKRNDYTIISRPPSGNRYVEVAEMQTLTSPGTFFLGNTSMSLLTPNRKYEVVVTVMLLAKNSGWGVPVEFAFLLPDQTGQAHRLNLNTLSPDTWVQIVIGPFTPTIGQDIFYRMFEPVAPTPTNTYSGLVIKDVVIQPVDPQPPKEVTVSARSLQFPLTTRGWVDMQSKRTYLQTTPNKRTHASLEVGFIGPQSFAYVDITGTCDMSLLTMNNKYKVVFYYTMKDVNVFPVTFTIVLPDGTTKSRDRNLKLSSFGQLEKVTAREFTASAAGVIAFSITQRGPVGQYGVWILIHSVVFQPI